MLVGSVHDEEILGTVPDQQDATIVHVNVAALRLFVRWSDPGVHWVLVGHETCLEGVGVESLATSVTSCTAVVYGDFVNHMNSFVETSALAPPILRARKHTTMPPVSSR